jgi:hypothetical protein
MYALLFDIILKQVFGSNKRHTQDIWVSEIMRQNRNINMKP